MKQKFLKNTVLLVFIANTYFYIRQRRWLSERAPEHQRRALDSERCVEQDRLKIDASKKCVRRQKHTIAKTTVWTPETKQDIHEDVIWDCDSHNNVMGATANGHSIDKQPFGRHGDTDSFNLLEYTHQSI